MSFAKATLRGTERKIFINMNRVIHMIVNITVEGTYTSVYFENGDRVGVTESPEELICEVVEK